MKAGNSWQPNTTLYVHRAFYNTLATAVYCHKVAQQGMLGDNYVN